MPVNLISPEGHRVTVPDNQVQALIGQGYQQETLEQEAGRMLETEKEEVYGGLSGRGILEGVARGATLGLSDIGLEAFGADPEGILERKRRGTGTTIAEGLGAIAPTALGIATPTALLARGAARVAAKGGVPRAVAAGAFEGAVYEGTQALAEQTLMESPISGEAIAANALRGAMFGGGAAGLAKALSRGAQRAATKAEGLDPDLARADKVTAEIAGETTPATWRDLFRRKQLNPQEVKRAAGDILNEIDNVGAGRRVGNRVVREAFSQRSVESALAKGVPAERIETLRYAYDAALQQASKSHRDAKRWAQQWARRGEDLPKWDDPDVALDRLGRLDAAQSKLDKAITDIQDTLGISVPKPPPAKHGTAGWVERQKERLDKAGAVAEVASTGGALVGQDVPGIRDIPVIGPLASMYFKYRALRYAVSKAGGAIKGTPAVRNAAATSKAEHALQRAVETVAKPRPVVGVGLAAGKSLSIATRQLQERSEEIEDEAIGLPDTVQKSFTDTAARVRGYLAQHEPSNPLANTPFEAQARYHPADEWRWRIELGAMHDPGRALAALLAGTQDGAEFAKRAVSQVYPAQWAETQMLIMERSDNFIDLDDHKRRYISRIFNVPLVISSLPGWPEPSPQPAAPVEPQQEVDISRSPSVHSAAQAERRDRPHPR